MTISFQKAKNNEDTVMINNLYLHSSYNPSKEAERFIQSLQFSFKPEVIFILEPGLSYSINYLRNIYPDCKIGVIRYIKELEKYNSDYDYSLNFSNDCEQFENKLFNLLGEEKLLLTQFFPWTPSAKIFPEIEFQIWKSIKKVIEKAKTLLITRQYFEKKWLINSINFVNYSDHYISLKAKINKPVLIISSGPSLKPLLKQINSICSKFFIICLSSAITVCLENKIIPDLCLSTDGGYWAGQHLKKLNNFNIPLALTSEAYCPKTILQHNSILPLDYFDGLSHELLKKCNVQGFQAKRNGTVSGTALELALSITDSEIYFTGLDLCSLKGFQHTQNNELEKNNSIKDNKIISKEKRLYPGSFKSYSLQVYLDWFNSFNSGNRNIYRIINEDSRNNSINNISDISVVEFLQKTESYINFNKSNYFKSYTLKKDFVTLKNFLQTDFTNENIKKQLYPLDYILLSHENNAKEQKSKIEKKHLELKDKILKIIYE